MKRKLTSHEWEVLISSLILAACIFFTVLILAC